MSKDSQNRPRRPLPGVTPAARLMDRLGRWVVTLGGIGVIAAVLGIFVFILGEAYPLFLEAGADPAARLETADAEEGMLAGTDPYGEVAYVVHSRGITFVDMATGDEIQSGLPDGLGDARIASAARAVGNDRVGLGTDDGRVLAGEVLFDITFEGSRRVITPRLSFNETHTLSPDGHAVVKVAYREDGEGRSTVIGITDAGEVVLSVGTRSRGLLGGGRVRTSRQELTPGIEGKAAAVATDGESVVVVGTESGEVFRFDLQGHGATPEAQQRMVVGDPSDAVTALDFLLGDVSLVIGTSKGTLSVWFPIRPAPGTSVSPFERIHAGFPPMQGSVIALSPSGRDKQFLALDSSGHTGLYHATSGQAFFDVETGMENVVSVGFAPKADGFIVVGGAGAVFYELDNPHPEATARTLFGKVWYESYPEPQFVWQSTGGSDEFEPKLSIIPLAFGTAKGTFYAMLFALPLAVLAAIYTSEFLRPEIRSVVKPTVELMASLPSVILGFLAGLWLAPLLEDTAVGVMLLLPVIPVVTILAARLWQSLPSSLTFRLPDQSELFVLVPVTLGAAWLALTLGPLVESTTMGGSFQRWLLDTTGTRYDQRNSLVVGFAMGFAVVPIIYTICEDALSSVPGHLRAGSLALGATRWQTAIRVVLPTASPGIFSATMIGFGRAVGETMIVLMATGNTPIMDTSLFNGMRTLSANIAVEIPEAPHAGTLYRVLFLTGALLAATTFVLNTLAEVVRQRLREKYSQL